MSPCAVSPAPPPPAPRSAWCISACPSPTRCGSAAAVAAFCSGCIGMGTPDAAAAGGAGRVGVGVPRWSVAGSGGGGELEGSAWNHPGCPPENDGGPLACAVFELPRVGLRLAVGASS